jgi:hypothetical protein
MQSLFGSLPIKWRVPPHSFGLSHLYTPIRNNMCFKYCLLPNSRLWSVVRDE